jgi:hypothetical protein
MNGKPKHTDILQLTIERSHDKPLPGDLTDAIAQRAYMFLYSQGCEVGVKATLMVASKHDHGQDD